MILKCHSCKIEFNAEKFITKICPMCKKECLDIVDFHNRYEKKDENIIDLFKNIFGK